MGDSRGGQHDLRLAELTAAISLATDLGTGQPSGHALRTCLLADRVARALGLGAAECSAVYYFAQLRFLGCTSDASETAALAGDEIAFSAAMAPYAMADSRDALPQLVRHVAPDAPPAGRVARVARALTDPGGMRRSLSQHCEAGARLARRAGLAEPVAAALDHAYERWDGKGIPSGIGGEALPWPVRIVLAARDADIWRRQAGPEVMRHVLARRRGRAYDPAVTDILLDNADQWLAELDSADLWSQLLDAEPGPAITVAPAGLERVLEACADFADLKSRWFRGHSRDVSGLAAGTAIALGLPEDEVAAVRQAGLVHDVGIVGVPAAIWDLPRALGEAERARVRMHSLLTEQVLGSCKELADLADLAGSHHERLDGSGYHRRARAAQLSMGARILAAAEVYAGLRADRPHRPAFEADEAASELAAQADAGWLDRRAVQALLGTVGQVTPARPGPRAAGLTEREAEVLGLIARGLSNRQIADVLVISPKTAGHHVEHIYAKAGVRTRAGATLFAIEAGLAGAWRGS